MTATDLKHGMKPVRNCSLCG